MNIDKDLLDRLIKARAPVDPFGKAGSLFELTKAPAGRALTTEMGGASGR